VARTEKIKYLVVNAPSAYNILLGRPTLNRLGAVLSTRHMKLKLPSMEGVVITIKSDQKLRSGEKSSSWVDRSARTRDGRSPG